MEAVIVDVRSGKFIRSGDYGNLLEWLMVAREAGLSFLRLLPAEEAYAEYA